MKISVSSVMALGFALSAFVLAVYNCACLHKHLRKAAETIFRLRSDLSHAELKLSAAEHDLKLLADGESGCNVCACYQEGYIPTPPHCKYAGDDDCFQWRGVCDENTAEDKAK